MTHAYHDPALQPKHANPNLIVLWDQCDDCSRIAERPTTEADTETLRQLWREMVRVERPAKDVIWHSYRTFAEATACRYLHGVAVMLERFGWGGRAWKPFE